jgi:hypothetical protein
MAKQQSPRQTISTGPANGVLSTVDPLDDQKDKLQRWGDTVNTYIPDTALGSGTYARPGYALMNSANQLGGANHQGQGIYAHTAADETVYNFMAVSGRLYRVSADLTVFTDVTPVGVTISGALGTRLQFLSFADKLIVNDGVNRPWFGTNLSSTPITGTPIQYDIGNSLWSAVAMTEYSGALVFLVNTVGGVSLQTTIAWSAPNDPTQGYFNVVNTIPVDYTWILTQTGSTPIYAIHGENVGLFYWRDDSIGVLTGPIGPNFQNSATHDAVAVQIGTRSWASVDHHGTTIFFADSQGRPQMWTIGNPLQPIWKQMRAIVDDAASDMPVATGVTACSAVLASLNLWLVAIWSTQPTIQLSPTTAYAFDVRDGTYMGRWIIGPGVSIESMGTLRDQNGNEELVMIGSKVAPASNGFGGYVWRLTNPLENVWTDNGDLPQISVTTQRLGYSTDYAWMADQARAILGSQTPTALAIVTPSEIIQSFPADFWMTEGLDFWMTESGDFWMTESPAQATATPSPSLDGTYRCAWGLEAQGRGFQLTLSPRTATTQWIFHEIELTAIGMMADPIES